jgi:cysteine desulfurase
MPSYSPSNIEIVGHKVPRLFNTSFIVFKGVKSDALMMNLDINGCCVGTGSACGSGMLLPSRTLLALGYSKEEAVSALRFSFGPTNTLDEVNEMIPRIEAAVKKMVAA